MRALVVGAASWNTILHLDRLPEPRPHMVLAERAYDVLGGTSAGKALNLAALGHEVHLHALLGADAAGERVRAALDAAGVVCHEDVSVTGTEQHVNLMAADGGRLSIYRTAASPDPDLDLTPLVALAAECDLVALDISDHVRRLIAPLGRAGIGFWTDLHDWDGAAAHHRDFADAATAVVLSDDALPDPAVVCERLGAGGRLVVCTHGARGATAYVDGSRHTVPAAPARVVDTNGAGDAFWAGLVHGLALGWPLDRSLRAGAVAGAAAVGGRTLVGEELTADRLERATAPPG